jgi:DNA-binding NarL/FixJ family response regulator
MDEPVRVLVVDDEPLVRVLLRAAIARDARLTTVGEAADGAEALRLEEQLRPDAVVLDVSMPVLDGITVAARLRARRPDCAIIVFSGSDDVRAAALEAGADRFVGKVDGFEAAVAAVVEVSARGGDAA